MSNIMNEQAMESIFEDLLEEGYSEKEIVDNNMVENMFLEKANENW